MSNDSERTTVPLDRSTRDRLDDLAPGGSSWDDRVNALLDAYDGAEAEAEGTAEVRGKLATVDDLEGLRDDLLGQLPTRTARELRESLDRR
jgi:hypothetical protein